jgi:preprotein translocase subunit YajC
MMNLRLIAGPILALAGSAAGGEQSPYASLILMGLIFGIFYFVLILPMRNKQRKVEDLIKTLKTGDKVIVNPGIFGTIVGVEEDAFLVRIDDKTRIKVLKSAVAGLQGPTPDMEKK